MRILYGELPADSQESLGSHLVVSDHLTPIVSLSEESTKLKHLYEMQLALQKLSTVINGLLEQKRKEGKRTTIEGDAQKNGRKKMDEHEIDEKKLERPFLLDKVGSFQDEKKDSTLSITPVPMEEEEQIHKAIIEKAKKALEATKYFYTSEEGKSEFFQQVDLIYQSHEEPMLKDNFRKEFLDLMTKLQSKINEVHFHQNPNQPIVTILELMEKMFLDESFLKRRLHFKKAAQFFYYWDDDEKKQFDQTIESVWQRAAEQSLKQLSDLLRAAIEQALANRKRKKILNKPNEYLTLTVESDSVTEAKHSSFAIKEKKEHELSEISFEEKDGQGGSAPLILELDAILTMDEQDENPIKTISEFEQKDGAAIRIIQITTPLFNLTDNQVEEFIDLVKTDKTSKKPIWFRKLNPWRQGYIVDKIKKLELAWTKSSTESSISDRTKFYSAIRKAFGHPSPNLRHHNALSAHYEVLTIVKRKNKKNWEEIFRSYTQRSSFPGPDLKFIKEMSERLRIVKENLRRVIVSILPEMNQTIRSEWGISPEQILKIPFLTQSLLSPNWFDYEKTTGGDNNYLMVQLKRQAMIELQAELADPLVVEVNRYQVVLITTNRPINNYRNAQSRLGGKVRGLILYDRVAINSQEEFAIVHCSMEFLETILKHSEILKMADFPADIKEQLVLFHQELEIILKNPTICANENWDAKILLCRQRMNKQIQTEGIAYSDKIQQLYYLMDAVHKYLIVRGDTQQEKMLNKQMYLSSLEKIIFYFCWGKISFDQNHGVPNIWEFCKSGSDRTGYDLDDYAAHLAFIALTGRVLDYYIEDEINLFLRLYELIETNGHNDQVRARGCPGSNRRKEGSAVCHPQYLRQHKARLKLKDSNGKLTKPSKELSSKTKIDSRKIELSSRVEAVKELGNEYLKKHRHLSKLYNCDLVFEKWLNKSDIHQISEISSFLFDLDSKMNPFTVSSINMPLVEVFGFKAPTSQQIFLLWLGMGEELFKIGYTIAKYYGIGQQFQNYTTKIMVVVQVERNKKEFLFLQPPVFRLLSEIQKEKPMPEMDFSVIPMPASVKDAYSKLVVFLGGDAKLPQQSEADIDSLPIQDDSDESKGLLRSPVQQWPAEQWLRNPLFRTLRYELLYRSEALPFEKNCISRYNRFIYWILCLNKNIPSYELSVYLQPLMREFSEAVTSVIVSSLENTKSKDKELDDYTFDFVKRYIHQSVLQERWQNDLLKKGIERSFPDMKKQLTNPQSISQVTSYLVNFSSYRTVKSKIRDYFPEIAALCFGCINMGMWALYRFYLLSEEEQEKTKVTPRYELTVTFTLWMLFTVYSAISGIIKFCKRRSLEHRAQEFKNHLSYFLAKPQVSDLVDEIETGVEESQAFTLITNADLR